jgi:RNA ligase (TIGR02306 family)
MSNFACPIVRIDHVEKHPNADVLDLNHIGGFVCISNRHENGESRYKAGDAVVYFPEAAILPEALLKHLGFWKETTAEDGTVTGKGTLNGSGGDRIKAIRLRQILSRGVIMPLGAAAVLGASLHTDDPGAALPGVLPDGYDMSWWMGVTKYEPPIPTHMAGQVCNIAGKTVHYDIENTERAMTSYSAGDEAVINILLDQAGNPILPNGVVLVEILDGN